MIETAAAPVNGTASTPKVRAAVVGLGKMGLSHLALVRPHPSVDLVAVCDASAYALSVLEKYTGVTTFSDYEKMLDRVELDAVVIATPSRTHDSMVRAALDRGINVFCEKPFTLEPRVSEELARLAESKGLVTQVGYHNRFVGAFGEVKRLVEAGAIGEVTQALGEAYGPVVLRPQGTTWRSKRNEGGGCLYDYAAHPIDLLTWYLGEPTGVGGTVLHRVFSAETEDQVTGTLYFPGGQNAQISVNWSDEAHRKMTTRVTLWGTRGKIYADRQECQVFLREDAPLPPGYEHGWNVRYTTDLTEPVWYNLRGEEYSAQIDAFITRVRDRNVAGENGFDQAAVTDRVIGMMIADAAQGPAVRAGDVPAPGAARRNGHDGGRLRHYGRQAQRFNRHALRLVGERARQWKAAR